MEKTAASASRTSRVKKRILAGCLVCLVVGALGIGLFFYLLFHRAEGKYFDSAGVPIHYTVEGQGEPLILVHGLGANADLNWRRPGITRMLARDFKVVAFDLRGHGLSGQPTRQDEYGIKMADDIARLMDHLKIPKAHVAGYSLGGFIVLKLLAAHPDRICSAAICAAGWKDPDDSSPIPNPYEPPNETQKTRPREAAVAALSWTDSLVHGVRQWAGNQIINRAAIRACRRKFDEFAVTTAELESNKVPVICLIGSRDGLRPLAEDLGKHMANLEFKVIEGANHLTTPFRGEFKRSLLRFFLKHRALCEPATEP
jgi:pimeloyl-ACP methyl ester carboxylesterase